MEASALQAPAGLTRHRTSIGAPLLRLRSDEQLISLFREGNDEAFRVIHDRYRQRLFAYTRQMLPGSRQDAEDALQDVFVRAYAGLRANHRDLALRAWLYRVAHNRCIDELRRPPAPGPEVIEFVRSPVHDPIVEAERRESLRRLIEDVRRLPDAQRSALLMRELSGMSYSELASALGVTIPAVKSLLVRARVSLAEAIHARDTSCSDIRDELILAHERGVRPNSTARRHLRDCSPCREFRREVRGLSRKFAALAPALGPFGVLAKVLGIGGGTGGGAAGGAAATGALGGGAVTTGGLMATGAGHIATLLAAAVVTAGGALEIGHSITPTPAAHHSHHASGALSARSQPGGLSAIAAGSTSTPGGAAPGYGSGASAPAQAPNGTAWATAETPAGGSLSRTRSQLAHGAASPRLGMTPSDSSASSQLPASQPTDETGTDGTTRAASTGSGVAGTANTSSSSSPTSLGGTPPAPGSGSTPSVSAAGGSGSGTTGTSNTTQSTSPTLIAPVGTQSSPSTTSGTSGAASGG